MGRKFLLSTVISLILLYGAFFIGFPALFNNPEIFAKIENLAQKSSGFNIQIKEPKFKTGIIPSIKFSAQNISILNDDNSKALEIKNFDTDIKLLPLILKNINIQKLSFDDAKINFIYDGKFKLGQYNLEDLPKTSFKINPKNVDIQNISINFDNKTTFKKVEYRARTLTDNNQLIKAFVDINDKTKLNAILKPINNGIIIYESKITGDNIKGFASGKITKLNAKYPELDLKIGLDKSRAEDILSIIPDIPNLSPDMDVMLIKQTGFWGNASANLEIKGKADRANVFGNVLINDAYAVKPIPNAQKATIKIAFLGQKLNLDVYVPTSPTQKVWVKGPINLYDDKYADLHITSTDSVDLKTAQIVLNPLHRIFYFDLGPVPIMDINGKGNINLKVTGTKQNPHAWGEFNFDNAKVSFLDIHNMEILNGSGKLVFDNQNTVFENKTGNLNGKPVSIKGTCSLLGNLNFDITSQNQELGKLIKIIQTSPMLKEIQELVKPIESAFGPSNIKIKLTGQVKDVNDIVFNKNLFAKGTIELLNNSIKLEQAPVTVKNTAGRINFNNLNADFDLQSILGNSQLKILGKIKNNIADIQFSSPRFNLENIPIKTAFFHCLSPHTAPRPMGEEALKIPYTKDFATINTSFNGRYNGKIDNIEYDKLYLKGKILSNQGSKSSIIINNSDYEFNNSNLKIPKLEGTFNGSPYNITLNVNKIFSKSRVINGYGKISSLDLKFLKELKELFPNKDIKLIDGKTDITARVLNNHYNIYTTLNDINLIYKPTESKITLHNGNVLLHDGTINLNKINASVDKMPIFTDGKIYNIQKNPIFNLYINTKPNQHFIDEFFNKNSVYPVKIKGDTILSSRINGTLNNLNTKSTFDIKEDSNLYYMGATIGDIENPVKLSLDSTFSPNRIKINNLNYEKIISSQNNKPISNTQLNASGTLILLPDNNIGFNNFKIKTEQPTDAKIFNIIFRKPFMKQGVFTSDIILNGTSLAPKILGKLNITSIDIPFFDSTIRDINLDFKNDKIYISSNGKVLANEVVLNTIMKNKLTPPYIVENIKLQMADLNINKITETLTDIEAEATRNLSLQNNTNLFDIKQLIIHNAEILADKIQVRNINADNFNAKLKLDKQIIDVEKFKFDIAQGFVRGNFKYNIPENKTNLDIHLTDANAAIMSEALFDLKGQVYGSVNGDFELACSGNSNDNCFKTLSGEGSFKVTNGRMPKLGSLEYLLKAGNIWKGGITGFSINSLIDLVTPLKTGEFESISGDIHISNGIADVINIYSSGNDLNMYMTGSYNILTSIADMEIFGSLSKNITTVFGKIKNASLNTLFNTIPGINDDTEKLLLQKEIGKIPNIKDVTDIYRIFAVEVNGDINGTDYVKSFRWVK